VQVGYLGPLEVRDGERELSVPGRRLRLLLGRLAAEVPRPVGADVLIDLLWPGEAPADPVNSLQSLVSRLRRVVGDPAVVQQAPGGYRLAVEPEDVDAVRFARLAERGHGELAAGSPGAAADTLRAALDCWRGEPLPDDESPDALALRTRLVQQHAQAQLDRLTAELELGRTPAAGFVGEVEALLVAEPLREDLVLLKLRALAAAGRPGEALAAYEQTRRRLADELGADPSPALRAAHAQLLAGPADDGAGPTNLRTALTSFVGRESDLARLDALLDAGRLVTVVGPGGAGKTRIATELAATWLPRSPDGVWLVELAPVTDPEGIALAVLDGLGAREAPPLLEQRAERSRQDARTRVLGRLAQARCLLVLDNCEHVVDAAAHLVADVLGRCPGVRVLATSREPLGVDGELLHPLPTLVLPDADPTDAAAADSPAVQLLLDRARAVGADLVLDERTTRDVVEVVRRLDGLPLAIELAAARLRVLSVAEVAARLSDRFRLLTGGRRTAVARHRTLRAVVEWSWELLSPDERDVAERFCVFGAGATLEAVAAVTGLDVVELDDVLAALVDKSLLVVEHGAAGAPSRFRMLETLREYGSERLAEAGAREATQDAHAAHYAELARCDDRRLRAGDQVAALRRFDLERENHLAALAHLCDRGDAAGALDMVVHLSWAWVLRENGEEARRWLTAVLEVPGAAEQGTYPLAAALAQVVGASVPGADGQPAGGGRAAGDRAGGDGAGGDRAGGDGAGGDRAGGDRAGVAPPPDVLERLAHTVLPDGDPARDLLVLMHPLALFFSGRREEAAARLQAVLEDEDPWVRAAARSVRMFLAENDGDLDLVRREADAAVAGWAGLGDHWGLAATLSTRAQLRTADGDLDGAAADLREGLVHLRALSGAADDVVTLLRLSDLRMRVGDLAGARAYAEALWDDRRYRTPGSGTDLFGDVLAVALGLAEDDRAAVAAARDRLRALVASTPTVGARDHAGALAWTCLAQLAVLDGDLDQALAAARTAYRFAVGSQDLPVLAGAGLSVAELALARGQERAAARVLGASARLRGSPDLTQLRIARLMQTLRERLGPELDALLDQARALDRASAVRALDPDVVLDQASALDRASAVVSVDPDVVLEQASVRDRSSAVETVDPDVVRAQDRRR